VTHVLNWVPFTFLPGPQQNRQCSLLTSYFSFLVIMKLNCCTHGKVCDLLKGDEDTFRHGK
jgi:hypothetical protein